ncbi:FK506-binding protein 2A-like [Limulus polyphemus]|uniref:peptidylprolyl isomerase n=1 Tax=Limulus polyphemus TaxID=6850 RepID=A0ABM1BPX6_LIMPO|nr:FK506-binding protein 2A-like [Limulus polyphemus]
MRIRLNRKMYLKKSLTLELSYVVLLVFLNILCHGEKVEVQILEKSTNCTATAKNNNFVTVHYISQTEDETVIDSTYDRGVPMEVQLGFGMLAKEFEEGILGMCVGEKRKIVVPDDKTRRKEPISNQRRIYTVEVLHVSELASINGFRWLDLNNDQKISEEEAATLVGMLSKSTLPLFPINEKALLEIYMKIHDLDSDTFISEEEYIKSVEAAKEAKDQMNLQNLPPEIEKKIKAEL